MSQTLGFGSNSVYNYEVVLANGTIVNANELSHGDLFWALKLAGSNYGIVTRFDMKAYPYSVIWGAVSTYPVTDNVVAEVLADFYKYSHDTNNTSVFKAVLFLKMGSEDVLVSIMANTDGTPEPPSTIVKPLQHTEKVGSMHDIVNDVMTGAVSSATRAAWFTLTTTVSRELFYHIFRLSGEVFQTLVQREGFSVSVSAQAIKIGFKEATRNTPIYNSIKTPREDLTGES